ncbi:MAG: hypothetical protein ACYTAN_14070 [Planctomycetota bacterium]|jgi:hypothetical protein
MKYKPDWQEARDRLSALWEGRVTDRPCISVTAPNGCLIPHPVAPDDPERKWLDPEWVLADLRAALVNTWWGGEAIPSYLLMGGWAVCLGGRPRFDLTTVWFESLEVDLTAPLPFKLSPDDPWRAKYEKLYLAVAHEAAWDDFLVGSPSILPANDLISMHMGPQAFMLALVDEPRLMREAITGGACELLAERHRLTGLLDGRHSFLNGHGGWMPFWSPESCTSAQSDVSCMLSPEMFDEFIVPELDICGESYGAMWYHLDGADARQHLPRLLSLPYMRVIQYTPCPSEPGNGPAHLDLYRQIQAAGKIVHIELEPARIEPLVRALDPGLLMLHTRCKSARGGRELLGAAKGWMTAPVARAGGRA